MRTKCLLAWFAGMFLFLILGGVVSAQDQKKTSAKEGRLSGTVHTINKDASAIIIRQGAVRRRVIYNAETNFNIQNKPGSIDDVIVGRRVTCLGKLQRQGPVSGRPCRGPIEVTSIKCETASHQVRPLSFLQNFLNHSELR